MSIIPWDDSYCTGDCSVDLQHRELFRMINELHEAIVANQGKQFLKITLTKLANYVGQHFDAEERLMKEVGYSGFLAHRAKHVDLASKTKILIERYDRGELPLALTLSDFLANWLKYHIREDDKAMIRFVQDRQGAIGGTTRH